MKSYTYKKRREEEKETTTLWDAFVDHLNSTYFEGAEELLPSKTISFEYESFKNCYAH